MDDDDVVWLPGPPADIEATQLYRSAPAAGGARTPLMAVASNAPVDVEVAVLKPAMQSAPPPRYFGAPATTKNPPPAPSAAEPAAKKPRTLPPSLSGRAGWAPSYKVMGQPGASTRAKPFQGAGAAAGGSAPWQSSADASAPRMPVTRTLPPLATCSLARRQSLTRGGAPPSLYKAVPTVSKVMPTFEPAAPPPGQGVNMATLSGEQRHVLEIVKSGKSIFFTGCAGTGKSYLLKAIIASLSPSTTFVTALTGVAALNIGGKTLHSFAGIGLGKKPKEMLVQEISKQARDRWVACKTLIIDEVSMMSDELFEKVDFVARVLGLGHSNVRKCWDKPFGGVQLVLTGDFLQLPPVNKGSDSGRFCFQSPKWSEAVPHMVELSRVFRQSDQEFVRLLGEIREGVVTDATIARLKALERPLPSIEGIEPTRLYSTNNEVDNVNNMRLSQLTGDVAEFHATDWAADDSLRQTIDNACIAPRVLQLKPGAQEDPQVMLLRNLDATHVNGSRGVVVSIDEATKRPTVKFLDGSTLSLEPATWEYHDARGKVIASRMQTPLKLAWAITIHKSQGMTIDYLEVNLSSAFEVGQAYVALSRARSMEGLRVMAFDRRVVRASPAVIEFYKNLKERMALNRW